MPVTLEQFGIDQLSETDRIELMDLIRESLNTPLAPLPGWLTTVLDERLAHADANPGEGMLLDDFEAEILSEP